MTIADTDKPKQTRDETIALAKVICFNKQGSDELQSLAQLLLNEATRADLLEEILDAFIESSGGQKH